MEVATAGIPIAPTPVEASPGARSTRARGDVPRTPRLRIAVLALAACAGGCAQPWYFRIDEVKPTQAYTRQVGANGGFGFCLSRPDVGSADLPAQEGQAIVGFDDYFAEGTPPFPCDEIRAVSVRAIVKFPLEKYDSVLSAFLMFDTIRSIDRHAGMSLGTIPGKSYATRIGRADPSDSAKIIDEQGLGWRTHPVEVNVTSYLPAWLLNPQDNHGFIIADDRPVPRRDDPDAVPRDNDALLSWYGNFRLRILYNVPDNPRTPPPP